MTFSDDALQQIRNEYATIRGKREALFKVYLSRDYKNEKAKEFAHQGFLRRLDTLVHCIENVFERLPPDSTKLPDKNQRKDAEINLQAFLFNAFACTDNLAWIWVSEKELPGSDGKPITRNYVGLRPDNKLVRASFTEEFRTYLKGFDEWFGYLEEYRHALAHRIPLYIPPYILTEDKHPAYKECEIKKIEALRRGDVAEYERISKEQEGLVSFRPWVKHSFVEKSKSLAFHPQLMADFNTIDEFAQKLLVELDR